MTSFSMDEQSSILNSTPVTAATPAFDSAPPNETFHTPAPVTNVADNNEVSSGNDENLEKNDSDNTLNSSHKDKDDQKEKIKAEKKAAKKLIKELTICKVILEEMEVREMVNSSLVRF